MYKIGIVAESKVPADKRAPITPEQAEELDKSGKFKIIVEPSSDRCFSDDEYKKRGILMQRDLSSCDILLGIKEINPSKLIPGKTYLFFSHTIKKQPYNRFMLQEIIRKRVRLIDYELLTDFQGQRVAAFGFFAGMVGAHNGLYAYGMRSGKFKLPRMYQCFDYDEVKSIYHRVEFPFMKIVLTGRGRVASGSVKVLNDMGIKQVDPHVFLSNKFDVPVFTQLGTADYYADAKGNPATREMVQSQKETLVSSFWPFCAEADVMLHGIFWAPGYPVFFSLEEMKLDRFKIQVIADMACDIAPESSIPCTIRPTTIADPVFGYDPKSAKETLPYQSNSIDVMAIDNLPSELPRDASASFGNQLISHVFPQFDDPKDSIMLKRATITQDGELGPDFEYLSDYAASE